MKKAGIFTEHFNSIGGGTVHSFKLIEFLKPYYDIDVYLTGVPQTKIWMNIFLGLDTKGLNFHRFKPEGISKKYDLFLNISHWRIIEINAKKKFAVVFFPQYFFPNYDYKFLANSEYTKKNIIDRWQISKDRVKVLYPPIMTKEFEPSLKKTNSIIHVSRIAYPRPEADKGHRQMIEAFKKIHDKGYEWTFHIVGQVHDKNYYLELKNLAKNYPIFFHIGISFNKLKKLYSEAKIYWHLTGITMPNIPSAQEHFGMAIVEAMAAGCVPVCLNTGGVKEIITDKVNGFLIENTTQLINRTLRLIENKNRIFENKSDLALKMAKDFDEEKIKENFYNIINGKS